MFLLLPPPTDLAYSIVLHIHTAYGPRTRHINRCSVEGDTYDIPSYILDDTNEYYEQEGVNYIDAAAAFDDNAGELNIFLINRDWESDRTIELDATGFTGYKFCEHIQLYSDGYNCDKHPENPDAVVPSITSNTKEDEDGIIEAELKALWNILRFGKSQ